jgi:hypothetical protein
MTSNGIVRTLVPITPTPTPTVAFAKAIAHTTNQSWRYNAGFLQGVSGVQLTSHHTPEFMAGYLNGSQIYWNNKGYAEGNNKLPMSSANVNYTAGYNSRH